MIRDLKLENVMLSQAGHAKLMDFGLSSKLNKRERVHSYSGTAIYIGILNSCLATCDRCMLVRFMIALSSASEILISTSAPEILLDEGEGHGKSVDW